MAYIPYGYKIKEGKVCSDAIMAQHIKDFFESYLSGMSIQQAYETAEITFSFNAAKTMLSNSIYLGTDVFPKILDEELFKAVQEERKRRISKLGKDKLTHHEKFFEASIKFQMETADSYFDNPKLQAEYLYSLIKEVKE